MAVDVVAFIFVSVRIVLMAFVFFLLLLLLDKGIGATLNTDHRTNDVRICWVVVQYNIILYIRYKYKVPG